ncbi:hypothetical protein VU04_05575 [Desulfobulbus sp. TB]|nr:hypothetical protein [Desulfobulbus sp. TB]
MLKKTIAYTVVLLMSLGLSAGAANAGLACNNVLIEAAGKWNANSPDLSTSEDDYYVKVKCYDDWANSTIFYLSSDLGEGAYATALTALASGKRVNLELAAYSWFSLVQSIRILNE